MFEKRDTVVLPILYNARHAVELALKFTINRLLGAGVISRAPRRNHDIRAHWRLLSDANLGDEELRKHVRGLEPFVGSLSRIDEDGQELRYHLNRDEDQSLSTYSLANLEVIRASLADLSKVIGGLKYRTIDFIDERGTNAYTDRLSRRDLLCIARLMPPRSRWNKEVFTIMKERIKLRFNLSNTQFSKALNVIKNNREMKALIAEETSLIYLPDNLIVGIIEQWRKLHPPRGADDNSVTSSLMTLNEILEDSSNHAEVVSALQTRLTEQQLAELQAIYYLGRDGGFPEQYEDEVEKMRKQHALEEDAREPISYLMDKTNFLLAVTRALPRLGRSSLSTRLSEM
jgi:hypothetical protein